MEFIILFYIGCFGVVIGSFLNVLIDRLPEGLNPFKGRSHCDHCKHTLSPFDLVPLFSFLLLGGRCRYCKKKISWQNPVIELTTGCMFVLVALYVLGGTIVRLESFQFPVSSFQLLMQLVGLLVVFSSFLVIFVVDLQQQIIPDEMLVNSLVGICIVLISKGLLHGEMIPLIGIHLLSALGALLFFLVIFILTKGRGMGFGDVKLVFVLGLLLGFPGIVVGLYVAFLTGAAVSLILIMSNKKKWGARIAFGPFLIAGAVVAFFYGQQVINWYGRLLS